MSAEGYRPLAEELGFPEIEPVLDRLSRWAEADPARPRLERIDCLPRGELAATPFTAPELLAGAGQAAGALARVGARAGDRVVLCLPNRESFAHAFLGAQWLGAIPVPLPSLEAMSARASLVERIRGVVADCAPAVLVADAATQRALAEEAEVLRGRPVLDAEALRGEGAPGRAPLDPGQPAFIQYTSGSTSAPRGVVVTHGNAAANVTAMARRVRLEQEDRFLSWLPGHHDMGLVGGLLLALHHGHRLLWMAAADFLSRPPVWLKAMSRFRATISGAPNFAYRLCLRMAREEAADALDLRAWRLAFCGAEPVEADAMRGFAARFARHGLRAEAMYPVYGLAEGTLAVTFPEPGAPLRVDRVGRAALAQGRAEPAEGEGSVELVSVGRAMPGHQVWIRDAATGERLGERRAGEVVAAGPSVTPGYYGQPPRPPGSHLFTGDLGYLVGGHLYVVDRLKDLIIVGGRNVSPVDVERSAQVEGVRMGRAAVVGVPDEDRGTEAVVVLVEPAERRPEALAALRERIDRALKEEHALAAKEIVLLPAGTLERTTSGKVMRRRMRDRYLAGELAALALG